MSTQELKNFTGHSLHARLIIEVFVSTILSPFLDIYLEPNFFHQPLTISPFHIGDFSISISIPPVYAVTGTTATF